MKKKKAFDFLRLKKKQQHTHTKQSALRLRSHFKGSRRVWHHTQLGANQKERDQLDCVSLHCTVHTCGTKRKMEKWLKTAERIFVKGPIKV